MKDFSEKLLGLYKGEFSGINLTRILDSEEFFEKQIMDSVEPLELVVEFGKLIEDHDVILDIGFGGGFPILPLAYKFPNKKFVGIDARRKKAEAVNEIAKKLGLDNVNCVHLRSEDLIVDVDALITFKAVGTIENCLKPLQVNSKKVNVVFYKGPLLDEKEKNTFRNVKHWNLKKNTKIKIQNKIERTILIYENVPRGTFKVEKKPLAKKLSDLL